MVFAKGSKVIIKKSRAPGVICESVGRKKWKVELVNDHGEPTKMYVELSSQMMRNPKGDEYPVNEQDPEEGEVEVVHDENGTTVQSSNSESSFVDDEEPMIEQPNDSDDDGEEADPDDEEAEDIPHQAGTAESEMNAFNATDFIEARGIETDTDKHQAKWDRYLLEKDILVDEEWSVDCRPPAKQSIQIGEKVTSRDKRAGIVVADDREGNTGPRVWSVQFEGSESPERNVPSTQLRLVKDTRIFTWKTVANSEPENEVTPYVQVGIAGFKFDVFNRYDEEADAPTYKFPFLLLLIHLWPGVWRDQLRNLNRKIDSDNNSINSTGRTKSKRLVSLVSEKEWWIVWGVIIAACPCHRGGINLFQSEQPKGRLAPVIDLSIDKSQFDSLTGDKAKRVITWNRFKTIKERLHFAFDDGSHPNDPWHPIVGLVEDFNACRRKWVCAGVVMVLDELMSAFQPRTTKTSLLPFLSFIFRKPKPLGTEFKCVACVLTGIMLYLEIQRGAVPMRSLPFHSDVGAWASCTLRLACATAHSGLRTTERKQSQEEERRHLFTADSWFGSVKLAEAIKLLRKAKADETATFCGYLLDKSVPDDARKGHEVIAAVKTASGWFPKKEMQEKMKDWPSGSYLVMECTAPETEVKLVAIGYKYNSRKVLLFVMTKDAGSTLPGRPYTAKFPDRFGNVVERKVTRPDCLSLFFGTSNLIDSHNHARQSVLGLEMLWRTPNPWFRIVTTLVGITVIDVWKGLKYSLPVHGKMSVEEFADRLSYDCYHNPFNSGAETTRGDIAADAEAETTRSMPQFQMPSATFPQMMGNRIQSMMENMTINCGFPNANPSPLSTGGVSSFNAAYHDTMVQRDKDATHPNLGAKRRCIVCGTDTRNECTHPTCKNRKCRRDGKVFIGTPICSNASKVRKVMPRLRLTNNKKHCLEIHREQCQEDQH